MTEFQTLDKTNHCERISFVGVVVKIADLQSGTNNNGDYTYKRITIQDDTASVEITAWNDDIKKFVLGGKYEIINAYAKEYNGTVGLGIQFAEVKLIGTDKAQSTMDETPQQSATLEETVNSAVNKPVEKTKLPKIPESFSSFIEDETVAFLQIEKEVRVNLHHFNPLPASQEYNGDYVGMMVKEIYRESKKVKFEKT